MFVPWQKSRLMTVDTLLPATSCCWSWKSISRSDNGRYWSGIMWLYTFSGPLSSYSFRVYCSIRHISKCILFPLPYYPLCIVTEILFSEPTNIPFLPSCCSNILCLLSKVVLFMSFGLTLTVFLKWFPLSPIARLGEWLYGYISIAFATLLTEILSYSNLGVPAFFLIFNIFFFFLVSGFCIFI